ncbi:MAG TPA: RNA degradosome polyphosphate kinase [Clostridiaceae bacterium]
MKNNDVKDEFINRELSWLEFNDRVLEEAQDGNNPLLERLKFLSIVSSNLDEFFMVRVAAISDQVSADFETPDFSGLSPKEQLSAISIRSHKMIYDQYNCYNRSLIPALKKESLYFPKWKKLTEAQTIFVEDYYNNTIYPVLTPMVVDKSRPFPLVLNRSLNIGLLIENKDKEEGPIFATVQVPSVLRRYIELPYGIYDEDNMKDEGNKDFFEGNCFLLLEDIIKKFINTLFRGHEILAIGAYRIIRNADLDIDEEEADDLLMEIQQSLHKRKWGAVIRLEVDQDMDSELLMVLKEKFEVANDDIYQIAGPIDLTFLMKLSSLKGHDELKFAPIKPVVPHIFTEGLDIFETITKGDILIHHPYESFDPVVELVEQSAVDPKVLAIKQTLYRVSGKSPIVAALMKAAENGKQVTVLVELKARFDEENNIAWAKRLEQSGCHVIYGLVGLKTHSKILLIVRQEDMGIRRYVHLGTGNYNDVTAKIYTDISLFTNNPYIGSDASAIFNMLSGYSSLTKLYKLSVAPIGLREKFISLIREEGVNAIRGKKAVIIAKLNSLVDEEIIKALYEASRAGVKIDLIVRGICSLKPGVNRLSERISVRSIVGRFLEHSRIYYFYSGGEELVFASSADWMGRNLDRRVELLFPVEADVPKRKLLNILKLNLMDTEKARILDSSGFYSKVDRRGKEFLNSQEEFMQEVNNSLKELEVAITSDKEFKPIYKTE